MSTNIVFVDSRVSDYQILIGLLSEPAEVFILDAASNGLDQMARYLAGRGDIDALHIISHGSQGALYLGNSIVDSGNIGAYQSQLGSIGSALKETGDILLYGCDVAQGDAGKAFIQQLAAATRAEVAGSVDLTGTASLGGNWELEATTGMIEANTLRIDIPGTLSIISGTAGNDTLTGTSGNDTINAGTGSDTIDAGGGDDVITLVSGDLERDTVSGGTGTDSLSIDASGSGYGAILWGGVNSSGTVLSRVYYDSSMAAIQALLNGAAKLSLYTYYYISTIYHGVQFDGIENLSITASIYGYDDLLIVQGTGGSIDGKGGADTLYADWSAATTAITWINTATATSQIVNGVTIAGVERMLITTGSGADVINNAAFNTSSEIVTGEGNDTVSTGSGNDRIDTGVGDDIINAGNGNNTITAGDGINTINTGGGNDSINAGAGNDTINVGAGSDTIDAGGGDDVITLVSGDLEKDTVSGGTGADSLSIDVSGSGYGAILWGGVNSSGTVLSRVYYDSSMAAIQALLNGAAKLSLYTYYYISTIYHGVQFDGIENLSITASIYGYDDLLIVQGTGGSIDGKGGTDTLYADWSAATTAVTWTNTATATSQLVNGVNIAGVERMLITTGSGADVINNAAFNTNNEIVTGDGNDTVSTGAGIDSIDTGNGDDTITAGSGSDTITAGSGNDSINAGSGSDTIDAGGGDDVITLMACDLERDTVSGGIGVDSLTVDASQSNYAGISWGGTNATGSTLSHVYYDSSMAAVQTLLVGAAKLSLYTYYYLSSSYHGVQFDGIENLGITASAVWGYDDLLISMGTGGSIDGKGGTDTLYADWSAATTAITWINPATATSQLVNGVTIAGVERMLITTGSGADVINNAAFSTNNEIVTGTGNDTVTTSGGNDRIDTGAGDDAINAGSGNNTITAGDGANTITVGSGSDAITAGSGNDSINAGSGSDTIDAGGGDDVITLLACDLERDTVSGGTGVDSLTVDASQSNYAGISWGGINATGSTLSHVYYDSSMAAVQTLLVGAAKLSLYTYYYLSSSYHGVQFEGIENLGITASAVWGYDDLLISMGTGGSIDGKGGTDTLYADWSAATTAITWINPATATSQLVNGVTIAGVERMLITTGSGADVINNAAFSTNNEIVTGTGNDTVTTSGGNDRIDTGAGDDTINAGSGNNTITAGDGANTITVGSGSDAITAGSGNDSINAGSGSDTIDAGGGDDVITLLACDLERDTVSGGTGVDSLTVDASQSNFAGISWGGINATGSTLSHVYYDSSMAAVQTLLVGAAKLSLYTYYYLSSSYHGVQFEGVENLGITASAVWGYDDLLISMGTGGSIDGKGGTDTLYADWSAATTAITWINPATATSQLVNGVTIAGVERMLITTGSGADVINNAAFSTNNEIVTGTGNDTVTTGGGNDRIDTGAGDDTINAGSGNNTITAGDGANTITVGSGSDAITAGSGNDSINAGSGSDTIDAGAGDDTITVVAGTYEYDIVHGGIGTDSLSVDASGNTYGAIYWAGINAAGTTVTSVTASSSMAAIQTLLVSATKLNLDTGTASYGVQLDGVENLSITASTSGYNDLLISMGTGGSIDGKGGTDTLYADWSAATTSITWTNPATATSQLINGVYIAEVERLLITTGSGADVIDNTAFSTNNEIVTGAGNDSVTTGGGIDKLAAGDGDDFLDGGAGADTLIGGQGNDTYVVDNVGDVVTEGAGEGTDLVKVNIVSTGATYTLGSNIDNGTLINTVAYNLTGNALDNVLTGNGSNNTLDGGAGADTLTGGAGNDTYVVDLMANGTLQDTLTEALGEGTDTLQLRGPATLALASTLALTSNLENFDASATGSTLLNLTGNELNNVLTGNAAGNTLDGGAGADTLIGGLGNDTYIVDNAGDITTETSALATEIDTVQASVTYTLAANLENLTLTGIVAINGSGNALANVLTGNAGNNALDGGAGVDTLTGAAGDDTYLVDITSTGALQDTIVELAGGGTDTLILRGTATLATAATLTLAINNLENLDASATGATLFNFTGNALDNVITGNAANNTLNGEAGADTLIGGAGNDTYIVDNAGDLCTETSNLSDEIDAVQSSVSYTLMANLENLTLTGNAEINGTGNALNNSLLGNTSSNTLNGGDGNDTLDGGAGADFLIGGLGNDTYIVDDAGDITTESSALANEIDTVQSSVSYTLAANLENLTLTGTNAISGTGNSLNNLLTGNAAANVLNAVSGNDTLLGGAGDDTYVVTDAGGSVSIIDFSGIDTLDASQAGAGITIALSISTLQTTGGAGGITLSGVDNLIGSANGSNNLTGNDGSNVLTGGSNNDVLSGGFGVDALFGKAGDDSLNGGAGDDRLDGGAGNDILDGGFGADILVGGTGDDTYIVDNAGDTASETSTVASEIDLVQSSVTWTLGDNLENLTLTGTAAINGTGNVLSNILIGNAAANTLNGGAGADAMTGGSGDDIYVVDDEGDVVTESSTLAGEIDTVQSGISYTLGDNLENLTLTGSAAINGAGNDLDNYLIGNAAANLLTGGFGNDTLDGGAGADTMIGGKGNDTYVVETVRDVVTETSALSAEIDEVKSSIAYTLGVNLENLTLTGTAAIDGTGNALDNILVGNVSSNTLNGGVGNDTLDGNAGYDFLIGGEGNDTYLISNNGWQAGGFYYNGDYSDYVLETSNLPTEIDIVFSSCSYSLTAYVENLTLTGFAYSGAGNELDNILIGNDGSNGLQGGYGTDTLAGGSGNDSLDGGVGSDKLTGGPGNDTFVVDNVGDVVIEAAGEGVDTVQSSISYALGLDVENLTLTGTADIEATGNSLANVIYGNAGENLLVGGDGNDSLDGGWGADRLFGGVGADVLNDTGAAPVPIGQVGLNIFNRYDPGAESPDDLAANILGLNPGLGVTHASFIGTPGAVSLFSAINFGNSANGALALGRGVLLTSGTGAPALYNTSPSFGTDLGVLGDVALSNVAHAAFADAGGTSDAAVVQIEFRLDNSSAAAVSIDLMFGSEEFPEFSNSSFVDIGVVFVDGVNYALFNEDMTQPLSVINANLLSDNFADNTTGMFAIEYNGISAPLRITAPLGAGVGGVHTIRIGVADTGDSILDSGLFVANLRVAASNAKVGMAAVSGDDFLDGGVGADVMSGGAGSDTYVVDNNGDMVLENAGGGIDRVHSSISYTLVPNVENLTLTGDADLGGTGNSLGNMLIGNSGSNIISGHEGNDTLDGGAGVDTLAGGAGDDSYVVDLTVQGALQDIVSEASGGGTDTLKLRGTFTTATAITLELAGDLENLDVSATGSALFNLNGNTADNTLIGNRAVNILTGGEGNDALYAGSGADTLNGDAGDDFLDGGPDADKMLGGMGNDTYVMDDAADDISENPGEGMDRVNVNLSADGHGYSLGDNIENATLINTVAYDLAGNALDNLLIGNAAANRLSGGAGNDTLDGAAGGDTLTGGTGDDAYIGDLWALPEAIIEAVGEGTDTLELRGSTGVITATTLVLADNLEIFDASATGTELLNLIGNVLDNELLGNNADNLLDGGEGADTLLGGGGDDTYVVDNLGDIITEYAGNGNDWVRVGIATADIAYALGNHIENGVLVNVVPSNLLGNALDNVLIGNAAANALTGDAGNDSLDGGAGIDTLTGGTGNDVYIVDLAVSGAPQDVINEAAGEGTDTVQLRGYAAIADAATMVLEIPLENLDASKTGTTLLNLTGNASDNVLIGNEAPNALAGGGGNDTLDGGDGGDTLTGGSGNDTYIVDLAATGAPQDTIIETSGEGTDTLQLRGKVLLGTTVTLILDNHVENLDASATGNARLDLSGNMSNNRLMGNDADNVLDGAEGADTLIGGIGNDTYVVDNPGDVIIDSVGTDLVKVAIATAGFTYTLDDNLENGVLINPLACNLTGNGLDNALTGNAAANIVMGGDGNDTLDGGAGGDTLIGGMGDDSYFVDATADIVVEANAAGTDTVLTTASLTLADYVENLTLLGTATINGTGNTLDNLITGNDAANLLDGGMGNDILDGGAGDDTLSGGPGNDTYILDSVADVVVETSSTGTDTVVTTVSLTLAENVENLSLTGAAAINGTGNLLNNHLSGNSGNNVLDGGAGDDTLTGGAGNDTFLFASTGNGQDVITDFTPGDRIRVSGAAFTAGLLSAGIGTTVTGSQPEFSAGVSADGLHLYIASNVIGDSGIDIRLSTAMAGKWQVSGDSLYLQSAPNGNVAIAGALNPSATLVASNDLNDANGLESLGYQWQVSPDGREWTDLSSGTSLLLTDAQLGKEIRVLASYVDGYGNAKSMASAASALVVALNAAPSGTVGVEGTATQGQILRASNSLADEDGLGAVTYQWQSSADGLNWGNIATGNTLELAEAQVGGRIKVIATYIDGHGVAESVASVDTAVVANVNDAPKVANPIIDRSVAEDVEFHFIVPADTFVDADAGDILVYTAGKADGTALPAWLNFDPLTHAFTGTPTNGDVGVANLRITARDSTNISVSEDFSILIANTNDAPVAGNGKNMSSQIGQPLALDLSQLFSDLDVGDSLRFDAAGLPTGFTINGATGLMSGAAQEGTAGMHHIGVTGTDNAGLSATLNFDLNVISGNVVATSVVTRGGVALPGVTAYELVSPTAVGSLYSFKNIAVDTNAGTGAKTLTADLVATGASSEGALDFTFHASGGAHLQNFELIGPITAADGWSVVSNTSISDSYGFGAIKVGTPIAADTLVGRLTLTLPGSISGGSILDLTDATVGSVNAPDRSLALTVENVGATGQINTTLPDSNLAICLTRGTADYLSGGVFRPVTAADALDALRLSVGLVASKGNSWKELISADLNHDGRVTAADALEILKVSVGIGTVQPSWVFVPNDASINPDLAGMTRNTVFYKDDYSLPAIMAPTSATITGILVGDVNNSWVIPS